MYIYYITFFKKNQVKENYILNIVYIITGIILAITGLASFIAICSSDNIYSVSFSLLAPTFICLIFGSITFGLSLDATVSYNHFIEEIEIQREIYEAVPKENSITIASNIVEINKELVEYQANRKIYKFFSPYPESVLNIKPIGIN